MFMGGAFGLCGAFVYGQAAGDHAVGAVAVAIALLASFAAGVIGSLIFSFLTITLRANQNVTGLALTIFGTGVGQFVGELMRLKVGGNVTVSNALKDAFANPVLPKFCRIFRSSDRSCSATTSLYILALRQQSSWLT